MKSEYLMMRIEPSLKRSFASAAKFQHQSLSQFLVQAGLAAYEVARTKGMRAKNPPTPRDGRFKRHAK